MGMYDAIKDGINLVQASDNMELLKNFMEIQQGYAQIQQELREKEIRIRELEEQLKNKESLVFNDDGYYQVAGSDVKYCSNCYDSKHKLISLYAYKLDGSIDHYECPHCGRKNIGKSYTSFDWNKINN